MSDEDKKTILLVEDEAISAMMEKKELEKYGYIVHHVGTGERAVQTILDNALPVDLILMDINLGSGIDGIQAAEQILNNIDIPIVFSLSLTESEIVEKTEKVTSYGYVVKNTGIFVLDTSIKMALKLFDANKRTKRINDKLESTTENLRAHQIELEIKSEELCENQAEIEALRLRYVDMYDMAPAGYFSLSKTGLIIEANLTSANILGVTRSALLKQPFTSFIIKEDQNIFYTHHKVLFEKGIAQTCELRLKRNNGSIFPAYIKAVSAHEGNGSETCFVIMIEHDVHQQDVNRRKVEYEKEKSR